MSIAVTVKEQDAVEPPAAVTKKVLVVVPTGNNEPLAKPEICVVTAPGQLSDPIGVTNETGAEQLLLDEFTVMLDGQEMMGNWLSTTVTLKEQTAKAPFAAVTRKVLIVVPTGKNDPLASPAVRIVLAPGQLSVPVGVE